MRLLESTTFDSLVHLMYEQQSIDYSGKTIGVFPGAFKPPHRGHYLTAEQACKRCDHVIVLMSEKPRLIGQNSTLSNGKDDDDSARWNSLRPGGNVFNKLRHADVTMQQVDRQTSASKLRNNLFELALNKADLQTFTDNISEFLPDLDSTNTATVVQKLMVKATTDKVITVVEAKDIWDIYIDNLNKIYKSTGDGLPRISLRISSKSPVADAYDLVLNELDQQGVNIELYVGQ